MNSDLFLKHIRCVTCKGPIYYSGDAELSEDGSYQLIYECPNCHHQVYQYGNDFYFYDEHGVFLRSVTVFVM